MSKAKAGDRVQFERVGYFCADPDTTSERSVWNRTVTLKDTWAKIAKKAEPAKGGKDAKEPKAPAPKAGDVASKPAAPKAAKGPLPPPAEILIDDVAKLDLRVGIIRTAGLVEGADKLLRFEVDLGEGRLRQIFSGIRDTYADPASLVGRSVVVIANLKPRQMKFGLSEGMLLAASLTDGSHPVVTLDGGKGGPGDRVS